MARLAREMRQTVARGTRYFRPCLTTKSSIWEPLGTNLQWKTQRRTLPGLTASITARWRESCGYLPVNFAFQARGKSYLTSPLDTSEEPTA
jgi:hypothetical protein